MRGPRLGHVYVDLATIRETATVDAEEAVDLSALAWPAVARVDRTTAGERARRRRAKRVERTGRCAWSAPRCTSTATGARSARSPPTSRRSAPRRPRTSTRTCWRTASRGSSPATPTSASATAGAAAVRHRFAVVAGGPGTGKTTTVARIVALLAEQAEAAGRPQPLIALAAPTAVAAARLEEAVHDAAEGLDASDAVRAQLRAASASTLHRLLGWRPDSQSRFRHHRGNRLPHDVVIVDETSMVSLSQMARLLEAVRPQARLVLVGDPGQLTSIEAGAVLGDIVGPADDGPSSAGIVVLSRVHRFGGAIGAVAEAVRRGDADAAVDALSDMPDEVTWLPVDPETDSALAPVHDGAVGAARAVIEAAREGDAHRALEALASFRVLCAHRRGPYGVETWTDRIERWLANEVEGFGAEGQWYVGRPLLVTENDYGLRLYNGDTGVVVATDTGRVSAAFERRGELIEFSPTRLAAVDSVYAMTVHKSQGSQFAAAAVLLPDPTSQILTRELLYTAVTRARERLILVGTEEAVRAAVARPVARASGLRWRLWGNAAR